MMKWALIFVLVGTNKPVVMNFESLELCLDAKQTLAPVTSRGPALRENILSRCVRIRQ